MEFEFGKKVYHKLGGNPMLMEEFVNGKIRCSWRDNKGKSMCEEYPPEFLTDNMFELGNW